MISVNSVIYSVYEIRVSFHYVYWVFFLTRAKYWLVHAYVYILQNRTLELEANGKEKIMYLKNYLNVNSERW